MLSHIDRIIHILFNLIKCLRGFFFRSVHIHFPHLFLKKLNSILLYYVLTNSGMNIYIISIFLQL